MSEPEHPVLRVSGATRRFGSNVALAGVDLTIEPGEIFALIGHNGAGKTTLVRSIAGRIGLDSGSISILGRDVQGDTSAKRLLGLVPQSIALYHHLTARENLEILGRLSGVPAREIPVVVDRALTVMGLTDRAADKTATLSGGMQRRLNIAAGTLHHPRLLLLDEPTVGVDVMAREGIHDLLRELRRDGLAILLTTHDLDQAEDLADRVGIISSGRILAEGKAASLVRDVFGEAKELIMTFAREPDTRGLQFLTEQGLQKVEGGTAWTGRLSGGFHEVSRLGSSAAEAGLAVDEVRVREPGLRGVFFHLTGRDLEP
ncbi:MAG: ABC transporter ATP-binding protein [Gemmatimonadota bacterium]|nr:MAG: ABC transporter ATP-binding protein [Gemmatimonadota bacterium]